jgi:hypothetical protein
VCDDVPGLAGHLSEHEVDVAAARDRAKRFEDYQRVGLENDERPVEERERCVRTRCGPNRVALSDQVVRRRRGEVAGRVTDFDGALEDREIRACGDHCGLVQQDPGAGHDQEQCRGERRDECERTSCPLLLKHRYRDQRHESRRMREVDRVTDFGERRRDDLELDVAEHVLRFALGCLVERVGHRERGARASELDEGHGPKLAEATRQLADDRRLGRDAKRGDRVAAHTSECARECVGRDEARAENRVRKGLLALARPIEVLNLSRGEELLRDEKLGELGLRADELTGFWRRRDADRRADHAHDLLRGLVLRDMRGSARRQREVADARVQREENDLGRWEVVAEHPSDLEAGHAGHRVVEDDQIRPELECLSGGFVAVRGLAHDLEVGVRVDERAEALAYSEVVVRDENSFRHEERVVS